MCYRSILYKNHDNEQEGTLCVWCSSCHTCCCAVLMTPRQEAKNGSTLILETSKVQHPLNQQKVGYKSLILVTPCRFIHNHTSLRYEFYTLVTSWKFNIAPEKKTFPKGKYIHFQPPSFRGELLNFEGCKWLEPLTSELRLTCRFF